jgi:SAM-dependent methyltransferase
MKILVAIASYGNRNDIYLRRLLEEYARLPYEVHIVVVSNIPKELGDKVEVVVGLPSSNPWSLPFAHKGIFAQRVQDYDLFIYSEDDTLITRANIDAFLDAEVILEPNEIAGFLRSEEGPDGTLHYSTVHNHYHWDVNSVCARGTETFAHFTNEHGACYLLTQGKLRRAIASGGFCVLPHEGRYDLLVSAATDPYTQCGFKKLICVSKLAAFTCKHLTNKYVGHTGIPARLLDLQVEALLDIKCQERPAPEPIRVEPRLPSTRWIKSYYEPCREDLVELVPAAARRVLSIGCGWGSTEEALIKRNIDVTAVPLDIVIGRLAAARGVHIIPCDLDGAPARLSGESFDALLISGLIHLVDDPVELLRSYRPLLNPGGVAIASFPNLNHASVWWRRITKVPAVEGLADYRRSGVHLTSLRLVTRWLRMAGFQLQESSCLMARRWSRCHRATLGVAKGLWASEYLVVARLLSTEAAHVPSRQVGSVGPVSPNLYV